MKEKNAFKHEEYTLSKVKWKKKKIKSLIKKDKM